jgi:hypothetical protein
MTINAADIQGVTNSVLRSWTKQRKAEERGSRTLLSRDFIFSAERVNFMDAAEAILPRAYEHVSGNGRYPVAKRQLYYACRQNIKDRTGRELEAGYFSQTLLVKYLNLHPDETATWKITADPRGTLTIPNTEHDVRIPCGTLAIEEHLDSTRKTVGELEYEDVAVSSEWPLLKQGERYQAVLYIEKEGFEPLLEEAKIADRYDLAILSCKGQSVVAARQFVDQVCRMDGGVPLLIAHDFDKAGFEIAQRLTTISPSAEATNRVAYRFENQINAIDIGLRLTDVEQYELGSETVEFKGHFARDSICTAEERDYLRSGRRVELNAFTSPQFIEWLQTKLTEQGLGKRLVPADDVLEAAYRRAIGITHFNSVIEGAVEEANRLADEALIPKTLKRQLHKAMKDRPDEAWDKTLYRLIKNKQKL